MSGILSSIKYTLKQNRSLSFKDPHPHPPGLFLILIECALSKNIKKRKIEQIKLIELKKMDFMTFKKNYSKFRKIWKK
jgi:hypothetical protein